MQMKYLTLFVLQETSLTSFSQASLRPAVNIFAINAHQILWFLAKTGHLEINGNLDEDEISLSIVYWRKPERNYDKKIITKTDLDVLKRWSPLNIHVG